MSLIKTAAKVAVASSVHGRIQRRQQQRWAAQDQRQAVAAHDQQQLPPTPYESAPVAPAVAPPPSAPPSLSTADKIGQLKSLGELRDSGVLTDAEFEAEKSKLLQA